MKVEHTLEDRVSISLKEYNGLKNDIKILLEDNQRLAKAFELDSKFVIISDERAWWSNFSQTFEEGSYTKKKISTVDEFTKVIDEGLKEVMQALEKQLDENKKTLLKIEEAKKTNFWAKLLNKFIK